MKGKASLIYLYVPWVFDRLGGVDVVVNNLYFGLRAQGANARIVEQLWGRSKEWNDSEGRRFVTMNSFVPEFNGGVFQRLKILASFVYHGIYTLRNLRSSGVTLINAHFPTKHLFMLCLLRRTHLWSGKIVLSFHGADVDGIQPQDPLWKFILDTAEGISVCSYALKDKLQQNIGADRYPVEVIHNGIEPSCFSHNEAPRDFDFGATKVDDYIVCLANFVAHKGQDILVEAFCEIHEKYSEIKLVLAGGRDNGEWLAHIKKRCHELQIADCVVFILDVPYDNVAILLKEAEVLVLPSRYESFGLVIAEAGLAGTPVVAFDVGGISELVSSIDHGLLVPVGDVVALAKAIESTLDFPERSKITADNLRNRVLNEFSCDKMCKGYADLFSS
ncbi:MAG: glycosyltransferase family 4 protein [Motiliproteus sp.]